MPWKSDDDRRKYQRERAKRKSEERRGRVDPGANGIGPPPSFNSPPPPLPPDPPENSGTPGGNGEEPKPLPKPVALPFQTGRHAVYMLQDQLNRVRLDKEAGVQQIARSVGYLIAVGLRALEVTDLAERVAALEAQNQ